MLKRVLLLAWLALAAPFALAQGSQGLNSGPMLGYSQPTEVAVWLQTRAPERAQLRFWAGDGAPRLSPVRETTREGDHIAVFRLAGLQPGTRYRYEVYLSGERVDLPFPLEFQTQAADGAFKPRNITFAVGSCTFVDEPPREDKSAYGGGYRIFGSIHRDHPEFMLWLGDNVYFRTTDWVGEESMRRRYRVDRANLVSSRPLLASCHHYAIWDDHDYGPNDSDCSWELREQALKVFSDYWPGQAYGGGGRQKGTYYRFNWGDVDFFMLDCRYYRSPPRYPDGPGKSMLGPVQLEWLKEGLASSRASFKVVVCGSQVLNPICLYEGYGRYPQERQEILDFVTRARIEGVVFLSGDRHAAELIRHTPEGGYPLYDFTSSPLTSSVHAEPKEADNPGRVPGTWVNQSRNYGLIQVTGPARERVMTLLCKDTDGKLLWQHGIPQKELTFPAR
ncbi:MAG: alkaline phosphatase D family protein [Candidatus Eremiobacterota bacterium]